MQCNKHSQTSCNNLFLYRLENKTRHSGSTTRLTDGIASVCCIGRSSLAGFDKASVSLDVDVVLPVTEWDSGAMGSFAETCCDLFVLRAIRGAFMIETFFLDEDCWIFWDIASLTGILLMFCSRSFGMLWFCASLLGCRGIALSLLLLLLLLLLLHLLETISLLLLPMLCESSAIGPGCEGLSVSFPIEKDPLFLDA